MASSMAAVVVRRVVSPAKSCSAKLGNRPFHSSGAKQMSGHGSGDGSMYSDAYIHAPHMYDIAAMKNKKAKMAGMVFGALGIGIIVPVYATHYQLKKSGPM